VSVLASQASAVVNGLASKPLSNSVLMQPSP
jgi:hypothetical protein